jgi:hypothetical protein
LTNDGVEYCLQPAAGRGVGKNDAAKHGAVNGGGGIGRSQIKLAADGADDCCFGGEQLVNAGVGVKGGEIAAGAQQVGDGGFAGGYATRETE